MPVLLVKFENLVKLYDMPEGKPLFIGSDVDCDICLPSPSVSHRHAVVVYKNGLSGVKDLGSFNGTYLNDQPLAQAAVLTNGDTLRIAQCLIKFIHSAQSRDTTRKITSAGRSAPSPSVRASADPESAPARVAPERSKTAVRKLMGDIPSKAAPTRSKTQAYVISNAVRGASAGVGELEEAGMDPDARRETTSVLKPRPRTKKPESGPEVAAVDESPPVPDKALRAAIEARLRMYALLSDLAEERRFFRSHGGRRSEEVLAELGRQDREFYVLPLAEEVEDAIMARRSAQNPLLDAAADPAAGQADQDEPEMVKARELALSQWLLLSDYNRVALPEVLGLAAKTMADEPLVDKLSAAGVSHTTLFGGSAYYMFLESLLAEAREERSKIAELVKTAQEGVEADAGGGWFLDKLFKKFATQRGDPLELAKLARAELALAERAIWLAREMAFLEKTLVREFWSVYAETAIHFAPLGKLIPVVVRAFLRFGVVSSKPWWLSEKMRDHVFASCAHDVAAPREGGSDGPDVLFADEYLTAVQEGACAPAPDDSLAASDRDSSEWKVDRAHRRMINGRRYVAAVQSLVDSLQEESGKIDALVADLGQNIAASDEAAEGSGREKRDHGREIRLLAHRERQAALHALAKRLEKECIEPVRDGAAEAENKFASGTLEAPSPRLLLRRECQTMAEIAARVAGKQERFLPLALREFREFDSDRLLEREEVSSLLEEIERRDPAIFMECVIHAKKRTNRVEVRYPPLFVAIPTLGGGGLACSPRDGADRGMLTLPSCLLRGGWDRQLLYLMADYRWGTARMLGGRDVMSSDTLAGAFMRLRWDWRGLGKEKREKGLIFNELPDIVNWRRIYELYMKDAYTGGQRLFGRNYDCYTQVIAKYFTPPEGVTWLKK